MYINTNLCQGIIRSYFPGVQRGRNCSGACIAFLTFLCPPWYNKPNDAEGSIHMNPEKTSSSPLYNTFLAHNFLPS